MNKQILRIRGVSKQKWLSGAGKKFLAGLKKIAFALKVAGLSSKDLPRLAGMKVQGYAAKEISEVAVNFNLAQASAHALRLEEQVFDAKIKKEEAEARLAQLNTLNAELDLIERLRKLGVKLYLDEKGMLTVLPRSLALPTTEFLREGESEPRNLVQKAALKPRR